MADRRELIASFEGRVWGGEMHKGGYIHVPQEEAEAILELLKGQEPIKPVTVPLAGFAYTIKKCGGCGTWLRTNDKFCPSCGKAVERDG